MASVSNIGAITPATPVFTAAASSTQASGVVAGAPANANTPASPAANPSVKTASLSTPTSHNYEDPTAGGILVTQYLDSSGSVISQSPSIAAIAYLRQGLSAAEQAAPSTNLADA